MPNKKLPRVPVDHGAMLWAIHKAGYSLRKIAPKVGMSYEMMQRYIKSGEMPIDLYGKIMDVLYPKTKTVWMRLGVRVPVSDYELYSFMERAHKEYLDSGRQREDGLEDCNLTEEECAKYLKRAVADGDSYIPEACFDQHLDWWMMEKNRRMSDV